MTSVLSIEKLSLAAPLGLCFHDAATGERVNDGLNVAVYPATETTEKHRRYAVPNRSGVFVLHKAYGLKNFPFGAGDAEFWSGNQPSKSYIVEVFDVEKRFQSVQFSVNLPVRGIYQWESVPPVASPNKKLPSIPLYSAPTRKNPGAMSIIRAELRQIDRTPASSAILEARFNGGLIARGIADREGRVALMFPTPAPTSNPIVSPPENSAPTSLAEQKWILDLTVKYQPSVFQFSPPLVAETDAGNLTDLRLALAQANGKLWADAEQTEEFQTAVLQFGKELILRSRATQIVSPMPDSTSAFSSFLFTSPAV